MAWSTKKIISNLTSKNKMQGKFENVKKTQKKTKQKQNRFGRYIDL